MNTTTKLVYSPAAIDIVTEAWKRGMRFRVISLSEFAADWTIEDLKADSQYTKISRVREGMMLVQLFRPDVHWLVATEIVEAPLAAPDAPERLPERRSGPSLPFSIDSEVFEVIGMVIGGVAIALGSIFLEMLIHDPVVIAVIKEADGTEVCIEVARWFENS